MLVYVRVADKDHIVCPVSVEDIHLHLRERLKREADEKARKKKEKEEAHLYTVVKARAPPRAPPRAPHPVG